MAIAYHTHSFEIPTATDAETQAGVVSDKVVVPSGLASLLASYVTTTALTTTLGDYVLSAAIGVSVQAYDADLSAIAALTSAADKVPYSTGAGSWALADFTSAGRALLDDADAAAQRTTLELGTAATTDATAYATTAQGATADSAIQPGDPELVPTGGTTGQVLAKTSGTDFDTEWTTAGVGDMLAATYDPQAIGGDAFDAHTHTLTVDGTGAAEVNLKDVLQRVYTPEMFGVVSDWDGSTGTDNAATLQAMADALPTGATVDFGAGQYRYASIVTFTKDVKFIGNGALLYGDGAYIKVEGSLSAKIGNISVAAERNAQSITASTVTGLAPGDLIILQNRIPESFAKHRTYYYDGEYQEIRSIAGSVVNFFRSLETKYPAATTSEIFKVSPILFNSEGVTFQADNTVAPWALWVQFTRDMVIKSDMVGGQTRCVYIDKCYNFLVDGVTVWHTTSGTGTGYGIGVGNSQFGLITRSRIHADNHSVSCGGNDEDGSVPCRHIYINEGNELSNQSASQSTVDFHGNCADCSYDDNTIHGSIGLGGKNVRARRNKVIMRPGATDEFPFDIKELAGGTFEFSDNKVYLGPDYAGGTRILGFEATSISEVCNESFDIISDRNIIYSENNRVTAYALLYWSGSRYIDDDNTKPEIEWHVRCNDNIWKGDKSGLTHILNMFVGPRTVGGAATYPALGPNSISVNEFKTDAILANTVYLCQFTVIAGGGSFGRTRATLPEFETAGTITIPSGGYQSGNLTLDHPIYPAVPDASVSAARGFSGANMVHLVELTATVSQRTVRLALGSTSLTVAADYARNVQLRVGMKNRNPY